MKFRSILGIAAIGGAYAYARKHGGFKNAFDHLMAKKDELVKEFGNKTTKMTEPAPMSTGYTTTKSFDRH
jgi:hypothetical protein